MGDFYDWLSDQLFDLSGGWPNVMQGFGGALVAVVGAFAVARWTVGKELGKHDERARDAAGVEAASQIITEIALLPESLQTLTSLQIADSTGVSWKHVTRWEATQRDLLAQVRRHGMLLPASVEAEATTLAGMLGRSLFDIDADEEEGVLIWVSPDHERIEAAMQKTGATLQSLQAYRRDPASTPPS